MNLGDSSCKEACLTSILNTIPAYLIRINGFDWGVSAQ